MGALTFAEVPAAATAELSITGATGAFTYDASAKLATDADVTFQYKVTACSTDSINYTITLNFVDCYCPEFDNDEDNYSIIDINNLKTEYGMSGIDQPPFSLSRRGGQTLRNNSAYIVTSGTNIACPDVLSDGVPLAMSGLALWLDPSDANTVHLAGSDLSRIDDKSGNGYYFETEAAINNPSVATIGTTTPLNSFNIDTDVKRMLCRNSSNNIVALPGIINPSAAGGATTDPLPYDVYVVVKATSTPAGTETDPSDNAHVFGQIYAPGGATAAAQRNFWGLFYNGSDDYQVYQRVNAAPTDINLDHSVSLSSINVIQFSHNDPGGIADTDNSSTFASSINGGAQITTASARYFVDRSATPDYVVALGNDETSGTGSGNKFRGQIGEIIVYNRVLTTEERAQITTYLVGKWST